MHWHFFASVRVYVYFVYDQGVIPVRSPKIIYTQLHNEKHYVLCVMMTVCFLSN